jgi:hypothetical protein
MVQGNRPGHGRSAEHGFGIERLRAVGSRDVAFKNRGALVIVVEGDKRLFNQYGVMLVNPAKHPSVKKDLGQQFVDWLISTESQNVIANQRPTAVLSERQRSECMTFTPRYRSGLASGFARCRNGPYLGARGKAKMAVSR